MFLWPRSVHIGLGHVRDNLFISFRAVVLAQAALDALNTIGDVSGVGSVEVHRSPVSGNGQYTWMVTFRANPGNLPLLTADWSNLLGTGSRVVIAETHAGNSATFTGPYNPRILTEERMAGLPRYVATQHLFLPWLQGMCANAG